MTRSDYADKDWLIPFWTLMLGRACVNRRIQVEEKPEVTGWGNFTYCALGMVVSGYAFAYAIYGG